MILILRAPEIYASHLIPFVQLFSRLFLIVGLRLTTHDFPLRYFVCTNTSAHVPYTEIPHGPLLRRDDTHSPYRSCIALGTAFASLRAPDCAGKMKFKRRFLKRLRYCVI